MEGQSISADDFQSICGCCLSHCKNTIPLDVHISSIFRNITEDVFSKTAPIQVTKQHALPKQLCHHCFGDLTSCYKFIEKYQRSEQKLIARLNQRKANSKVKTFLNTSKPDEIEMNGTETLASSFQTQAHLAALIQKETNIKIENEEIPFDEVEEVEIEINGLNVELADSLYPSPGVQPALVVLNKKEIEIKMEKEGMLSDKIKQDEVEINDLEMGIAETFDSSLCSQKYNHESLKCPGNNCYFCHKSFASKKERVIHEATHTGHIPYECRSCDKSFIWKKDQIHHTNIHIAEKLYKCSLCEKSFMWKQSLVIHERTHMEAVRARWVLPTQEIHATEKPFFADASDVTVTDLWSYLESSSQDDTAKTEKALNIFRFFGVLPFRGTIVKCPNCHIPLSTGTRMGTVLHWRYSCTNGCVWEPTQNTVFFKVRLKETGMQKILIVMSCWLEKAKVGDAVKRSELCRATCLAWYKCCRDIARKAAWHAFEPIGDAKDIVEVDIKVICKLKNNQDLWVFGGISRTSRKLFCIVVDGQNEDTLLPLMQTYIDNGSYVCTDACPAYKNCGAVFAGHGTANRLEGPLWAPPGRFHSSCLDGPPNEDGLYPYRNHIQNIKSTWERLKVLLGTSSRVSINTYINMYLGEFMYRENILKGCDGFGGRLQRFLQDIKQAYPGIGRVAMAQNIEDCQCHVCEPLN